MGYYLVRNGTTHGWFRTKAEADRHAAVSNMRGGCSTKVVAEADMPPLGSRL